MQKPDGVTHRFSRPIVKISVWSVALGIMVMLLSIAIVTGFQQEIRNKVIGFGAHIQITAFNANPSLETNPVLVRQEFYEELKKESSIKNIQVYALKPGVIQHGTKDSTGNIRREIQGIVTKGVSSDYDWSFFSKHLTEGRIPSYHPDSLSNDILISRTVARRLFLKTGDTVSVFFIKDSEPRERKLLIAGIYHTGMEEFDKQVVITDINHIRRINNWGVNALLYVRNDVYKDQLIIEAGAAGERNLVYDFGKGFTPYNYILLKPGSDTTIRVIITSLGDAHAKEVAIAGSSDYPVEYYEGEDKVPDTAWLELRYFPAITSSSEFLLESNPEITNAGDTHYVYHHPGLNVIAKMRNSGGSGKYYTGGFEVLLHNWNDLEKADKLVYRKIGPEFQTKTIKQLHDYIFKWLVMLDINVWVILGLMLLVSLINMCSTLLVLILERTNMIGILKSLGANNNLLQKIFLYNGLYMIGKGLVIGNMIALSLIWLQDYTGILTLNQDTYFIDVVPVNIDWLSIILINVGTIFFCFITLLLPAHFVSRISPVKAIRFS